MKPTRQLLAFAEIRPLTERGYFARSSTAVLVALGDTLRHRNARSEDIPKRTVFVIMTNARGAIAADWNAKIQKGFPGTPEK